MYDWKAKISRLLELPGLTDDQRMGLKTAGVFATWGDDKAVDAMRSHELPIRDELERLIEARGWLWTIQKMAAGFDAYVFMANDELEYAHDCATPAQALMDALLSAVKEAQQ